MRHMILAGAGYGQMPKRGRSQRRAGFTLLELLVVMSVVTILIAILLPQLSSARANARRTACQATLKGIGVGFSAYLDANDRIMPDGAVVPSLDGAPPRPPGHWPLPLGMIDYVKSPKAWRCPSDNLGYASWATGLSYDSYFSGEGTSYGFNPEASGKRLEQNHMYRDFGDYGTNELHIIYDFANFHGPSGDPRSKNVLFGDWHVGTIKDITDAAGAIPVSATQAATLPH